MDSSVANRLKQMRKLFRRKDKKSRRLSLNDWRKEKRFKLMNEFRKIESEWFVFDFEEDTDCGLNTDHNSNCLQFLFEYLNGRTLFTESMAKKYFKSSKVYLKVNGINCEELISHPFFRSLSDFVSQQHVSNQLKFVALDVIEYIISAINIEKEEELILKSGLIFSLLVNFNTFDVELLNKTVVIVQTLTRFSLSLLTIAYSNGYLIFLMKIIETTHVFSKRMSTENIKSKGMSEKKLNLIRNISESLRSAIIELNVSELFRDLYPLLAKLIQFKDKKIVSNALSTLIVMIEREPQSVTLLNRYLITSITNLMSNDGNENISLFVLCFWKLFIKIMSYNDINFLKYVVIESNLIKKLNQILSNDESNRLLLSETAGLLSQLIDKFDDCFELIIEIDIKASLINSLTFCKDFLCKRRVVMTISHIVDKIKSYQMLNHLLELQVIESLTPLLMNREDPNLTAISSKTLTTIFKKSEEFGLKDIALIRAQYSQSLNPFI